MSAIRSNTLKSVLFPVPKPEEQHAIEQILRESDNRLKGEVEQCKKLLLLKKGLMDDLLTGRVRITKLLEKAA